MWVSECHLAALPPPHCLVLLSNCGEECPRVCVGGGRMPTGWRRNPGVTGPAPRADHTLRVPLRRPSRPWPHPLCSQRTDFILDQVKRDQSREWLRSQRLRGAQGKDQGGGGGPGRGRGERSSHPLSLPQDGCWLGLPPGSQGIVEE